MRARKEAPVRAYEPPSPVDPLDAQVGEVDGHTIYSPTSSRKIAPDAAVPAGNVLSRADRWMTDAVRGLNQRNAAFHWWATAVTLTVDEVVVFPVPTFVGLALYFCAADPALQHGGQLLMRLKDDFGALSLIEQALKLTFCRTRPYVPKTKPQYAMYAEHYSFPSGHTMRGVYTAWLFADPALSPLPAFGLSPISPAAACAWGAAVAVSRVALGKHYVFDTLAGTVFGALLLWYSPLPTCGLYARMVLASIFTLEVAAVALSPTLRDQMRLWPAVAGIVFFFWATMPFAAGPP
eukprot:TRINITY_DN7909_c0_g1_i1.p2 TRINITY_DN7909_c0_g1~~TRINITY_DN7909_c0_g1_i1.p2  ORF type:complete len:293 (+),score=74.96 TRINITY_DN7909_c0_g1_i1:1133-2011(+)